MLYDRWRKIAQQHRNQIALHDLSHGRQWTFAELQAASEEHDTVSEPIVFPSGMSVDFILTVLRAWRLEKIVCPLEPGQPRPAFAGSLPQCVQLKTTSASTGAPRMVAFQAHQLAADAQNIVATMGLRAEWPNLGVISLAHSYGFSNLILPLLLHGIPVLLLDSPLPERVRAVLKNTGPLTLAAVPALWRTWHDAKVITETIRLAISAGAPLPVPLEEEIFSATGVKIHNFYGATECGGIAYDRSSIPRTDAACVGTAMDGVALSVNDQGCLEVRTQAVGTTYWPEPSASLANGIFQTADLAELRGDAVFLRGRAGDQINVAGRKISPELLEEKLRAHPAVRECLVFGVPSDDTDRTDVIVACISKKAEVTAEILKQFLLSEIPAWQTPRRWWFVDSLGANERGKLSRAQWRERFLQSAK